MNYCFSLEEAQTLLPLIGDNPSLKSLKNSLNDFIDTYSFYELEKKVCNEFFQRYTNSFELVGSSFFEDGKIAFHFRHELTGDNISVYLDEDGQLKVH